MEKRVVFRSGWLPWALLAPQAVVIAVFFFWPAGQALMQSLQQQDAFGTSVEWVGLDNFRALLDDETYLASFQTTAVFSLLVAVLGLGQVGSFATLADVPWLVLLQGASAAAMFAFYFRLQAVGGPVYLSQIGYVAAAIGLGAGVLFLDEHYRLLTWLGAAIIVLGVIMTTKAQSQGA